MQPPIKQITSSYCCQICRQNVCCPTSFHRPHVCPSMLLHVCATPVCAPHSQQKDTPHLHVTWLQPPFFSTGLVHLGQGLVFAIIQERCHKQKGADKLAVFHLQNQCSHYCRVHTLHFVQRLWTGNNLRFHCRLTFSHPTWSTSHTCRGSGAGAHT